MDEKGLIELAKGARNNSYAPYSKFKVGAAVLTDSGKVFTGINVENVSFGATNCAERTAVFKAVSEGERKIVAVAIYSENDEYLFPCGICRQVIAEFADENAKIICSRKNEDYKVYKLGELLPEAFLKF
jgi:cytidine deaminase